MQDQGNIGGPTTTNTRTHTRHIRTHARIHTHTYTHTPADALLKVNEGPHLLFPLPARHACAVQEMGRESECLRARNQEINPRRMYVEEFRAGYARSTRILPEQQTVRRTKNAATRKDISRANAQHARTPTHRYKQHKRQARTHAPFRCSDGAGADGQLRLFRLGREGSGERESLSLHGFPQHFARGLRGAVLRTHTHRERWLGMGEILHNYHNRKSAGVWEWCC